MFLLEEDLKFPKENFRLMKNRPYGVKPLFSMKRVQEWHQHWKGQIYISFSGGLDSSVLAYIVCQAYEQYHLEGKIPLVFSDTGMEFPEIREFVHEYTEWLKGKFPDLDIELVTIRPKHTFQWVCENKGFPLISKETAAKIRKLRHGKLKERYRNYLLHGDERGKYGMLSKKWQYLADTREIKEDISDQCCDVLKKEPFKRYIKETGRYPFIGITQDESFRRENQYNHTGCNVYDGTTIKSQPMGFWPKQEVIRYAVENEIPICSVYGKPVKNEAGEWVFTGEQRTGCVLCGFGCHLESEPNRIQRLCDSDVKSHRAMYDWGMKIENNGVRYKEALQHCHIATEGGKLNGRD
jgi:3'-phosphoadenosine 5'-phosphosulfate sulfotransferase (PAPS reductase)/FAD synthetase